MMIFMIKLAAVTIATIGFALIFGVPSRYYAYCGLIGGAGWLIYQLSLMNRLGDTAAIFVATVGVILLSRWFAVRKRCPVTIFLISGIIPLVPGAGIYWAAYYIVTNQLGPAAETGFQAFKAVAAIVLGIVFVFELPQRMFRFPVRRSRNEPTMKK